MPIIPRWGAYALSVAVGLEFFAAPFAVAVWRDERGLILAVAGAAVFLLTALAGAVTAARLPDWPAARFAAAPALFSLAAYGFFLLVETDAARLGAAAAATGLLLLYFSQLEKVASGRGAKNVTDLLHLLHALHAVTLFCGFVFVFGIDAYFDVTGPLEAGVVATVSTIVAWQSLPAATGAARQAALILSAAFGALGAELYLSFSFLPTPGIVNATAAAVLFSSALHVCRQVFAGVPDKHERRELAVAGALAAIVLLSARWS